MRQIIPLNDVSCYYSTKAHIQGWPGKAKIHKHSILIIKLTNKFTNSNIGSQIDKKRV